MQTEYLARAAVLARAVAPLEDGGEETWDVDDDDDDDG
jgi:hypothetical protein